MKKITPFIWFDNQAEEAMNFYTSIFKSSKKMGVTYYGEGSMMPKGTVMTACFELNSQNFVALNGGPVYSFTPAVSFAVECENQEEIDYYWEKLSEGGKDFRCGWLTDKFGVTWQVFPKNISELIVHDDPEKASRAITALMQMEKIDIIKLKDA